MPSVVAPSFAVSVNSISAPLTSISALIFYTRGCILRSVAPNALVAVVALSICPVAIEIPTFRGAAAPAVGAVNSISAPLTSISAVIFYARGCIRRSVAADAIVAALSICPVAIATFRSAATLAVAIVVNRFATAVYAPFAPVFAMIFSMAVAMCCIAADAVMPFRTAPNCGRRAHAAWRVIPRSPPARAAVTAGGSVPPAPRANSIGEPPAAVPVPGTSNVIPIPVVSSYEGDIRDPEFHEAHV